jgi:hypothetical protein
MVTSRRKARIRMFLGNTWTDVTSRVLQRDPIEIERGRADESAQTNPQTATLTLKNENLDFSTRNPMGLWYGQISRNVPLTIDLPRSVDTFSRTVVNGWGTNDSGHQYQNLTTGGSGSDWNVAGGKGTMRVGTAGNYMVSTMFDVVVKDVDLQVDFTLPFSDVLGDAVEPANLYARYTSTTSYYMVRVNVDASEVVRVGFEHPDTGQILSGQPTGLTHVSGIVYRVRFQVEGQTLRAKVWNAAGNEPLGWQATAHDAQITAPGFVGIRTGVAGLNTNVPVVVSYDNFEVRSYRFAGEVSNFPTDSDPSNSDRYSQIEASGITRRLGQGESPVRTPSYQYVTRTLANAAAYWELSEGATSTQSVPVIGTSPLSGFQNAGVGTFKFGVDADLPGVDNCVEVAKGAQLAADVSPVLLGSEWHVGWGMKWSTASGAQMFFRTTTGAAFQLAMTVFTNGLHEVYLTSGGPGSTTIVTFNAPTADLEDWHYYTLNVKNNGGSIDVTLGYGVDTASIQFANAFGVAANFAPLVRIELASPFSTTEPVTLSNVVVFGTQTAGFLSNQLTLTNAFFGNPMESALSRMDRLCAENSVPFFYRGVPFESVPMGPQPVGKFLDLLRECAATDAGSLYEPRGTLGICYRARTDAYSQPSALTVNASDLLPPFRPVEDDKEPMNDVTAKSRTGAAYRYQLTSGRMSTQDIPNGVGRYDSDYPVNTWYDTDLSDVAGWQVALGTVDEARFPDISISMDNSGGANHTSELFDLDIDDYFVINNASGVGIYDPVQQILRGLTEKLVDHVHEFGFNSSPAAPYDVAVLDAGLARVASGGNSTLDTKTSPPFADATFSGTVVDSWSNTATGNFPWTLVGVPATTTDFDEAAGFGTVRVPAATDVRTSFLDTIPLITDVDVYLEFTSPVVTVTGGPLLPGGAALRESSSADFVYARVEIAVGNTISLGIRTGAGASLVAQAATGVAYSAGTKYSVRIRAEGSTVRARLWNTSVAEPTTWLVTATGVPAVPGGVGIRTALGTLNSNGPAVFSYDRFIASALRGINFAAAFFDVTNTTVHSQWTTAAGDFPFPIIMNGEVMSVVNITGTGLSQTFQVTRSVNGVVRDHPQGSSPEVFRPIRIGM